jgi:phosphatidylserine/phosphatidylglycerophosphate/cardiolipin synthase-like enzyme
MKKLLGTLAILIFTMLSTPLYADEISVCFTPGQNCTQQIVNVINNTQKTLLIQAYQFTSFPIEKAVVSAKQRGVDVKIILDKSQYNQRKYSSSIFFNDAGIPVWIDYKPNIAHNKIMISDGDKIITGSFNFSKNAQDKNAENLLVIHDSDLAQKYTKNFYNRLSSSDSLNDYISYKTNNENYDANSYHHKKYH